MTISETIQKAKEGGYNFSPIAAMVELSGEGLIKISVLDPLFWQSLGKAMGWKDKHCLAHPKEKVGCCGFCFHQWKNYWHEFIDHLSSGKDISSFFENL